MSQFLKTFKGLKKGQKIRVGNNLNSANWEVNKTYTLIADIPAGSSTTISGAVYLDLPGLNTIYISNNVTLGAVTLAELKSELKELQSEKNKTITELKRKIKFCEVNGEEEYDTDTEKVYQVLKTLNTKSSDMEKAQAIAKLIN